MFKAFNESSSIFMFRMLSFLSILESMWEYTKLDRDNARIRNLSNIELQRVHHGANMLVHQSRCSCELQIVCALGRQYSESSTYHRSALMCKPGVLADEIQWECSVPWVKPRPHGSSCKVRARKKDFLTPTKFVLLRQKASIVFSLSQPTAFYI